MSQRYSLHGLVVACDYPLDAPVAPDGATTDLTVNAAEPRAASGRPKGRVLGELELPGLDFWCVEDETNPDRWLLRYGSIADVEIAGTEVTIHPNPEADLGLLPILIGGGIIAHVLSGRQIATVLHAGAVEHEGAALAVAGPSGTGKSTTTALLCAAGAPLVTDDTLAITVANGGFTVARGTTTIRLRESAAELAERIPGATIQTTADGRVGVTPKLTDHEHLPLAAIAIIRPDRDNESVTTERLRGADAAIELLKNPRVIAWTDPARRAAHFAAAAEIASSVPVLALNIPWGPPFAEGLGAEALHALAEFV